MVSKKENLEDENAKLKELREQLKGFMAKQEELSSEKQYYDYASTLLKDRKSTRLNSSHIPLSRMPSSA